MQIRNIVFGFLAFSGFLAALPARAQAGSADNNSFFDGVTIGRHLSSPATANTAYPLKVWIRIDRNKWDSSYGYFHGLGKFTVDPTAAAVYSFDYQCPVSFADRNSTQYQARWLKPGKQLQVLLFDSEMHKTRTCNLATLSYPRLNPKVSPPDTVRNANY